MRITNFEAKLGEYAKSEQSIDPAPPGRRVGVHGDQHQPGAAAGGRGVAAAAERPERLGLLQGEHAGIGPAEAGCDGRTGTCLPEFPRGSPRDPFHDLHLPGAGRGGNGPHARERFPGRLCDGPGTHLGRCEPGGGLCHPGQPGGGPGGPLGFAAGGRGGVPDLPGGGPQPESREDRPRAGRADRPAAVHLLRLDQQHGASQCVRAPVHHPHDATRGGDTGLHPRPVHRPVGRAGALCGPGRHCDAPGRALHPEEGIRADVRDLPTPDAPHHDGHRPGKWRGDLRGEHLDRGRAAGAV